MKRKTYISLLFLVFAASINAQSWPRFFWNQIIAADTVGAIAIATPGLDGSWSDSLRFWQGKLRIGLDTAATLQDVRDSQVDISGTAHQIPYFDALGGLSSVPELRWDTLYGGLDIGSSSYRERAKLNLVGTNFLIGADDGSNANQWEGNTRTTGENKGAIFKMPNYTADGYNSLFFAFTNSNGGHIYFGGNKSLYGPTSGEEPNAIFFKNKDEANYATMVIRQSKLRFGGVTSFSSTPTYLFEIVGTGAMLLPIGTTAQRPTGTLGLLRASSTNSVIETNNGSLWNSIVTTALSSGKFTEKYVPFSDANGMLTESSAFSYTNSRLLISNTTNQFWGGGNIGATGLANTAIGNVALSALSTGTSNIAVGSQSSTTLSTGSNNVSVGALSLFSATSGGQNVSVGNNALRLTNNSADVAIGFGALQNSTVGSSVAVGWQSLNANTTGIHNTATGYAALLLNASGDDNTAIGYLALNKSTGDNNTAIGASAIFVNTTGYSNTAIGSQALYSNTTGFENNAAGFQSLLSNKTGSSNIAGGFQSMKNNRTGSQNVAFGSSSLQDFLSKNGNTAVGYNSGSLLDYTQILIDTFDHTTERVYTESPHGISVNTFLKLSSTSGSPTAPDGSALGSYYEFSVVNDTVLQFVNITITSNGSGAMELRQTNEFEYTTMLGYNSQVYKDNMVSIGAHAGTGAIENVRMRNYDFNADQDTTGLDGYVLTFNSSTKEIELQSISGIDTNFGITDITLTGDRTHALGSNTLTFDATAVNDVLVIDGSTGDVGILGLPVGGAALAVGGTESIIIPSGTTGQEPTPQTGMIRHDATKQAMTGYQDGDFRPMVQTFEMVSTTTGATVVVYKNTFLYCDISTTSQTITLDPTDLSDGSIVKIFVTNQNDFTLDSDTGSFFSTTGSFAATQVCTEGVYEVVWDGTNWFLYKIN